MLGYLLLAYLERFLFALLVYFRNAKIVARRDPDNRAQRLHNRIVLDLVVAAEAVGYLKALAGFYNDLLAGLYDLSVRGKIITLSTVFKFNAYNFSQLLSSFPLPT